MRPRRLAVFFDARTAGPGMGGVGRYALNLLRALATLERPPAIRALVRADCAAIARRDPALGDVELVPAPVSHDSHPWGDLWLAWPLPRRVRPDEVYHGPSFLIPGGARPFARVLTVHDAMVWTHATCYPARFRAWLRWRIRIGCRAADRIIVPTQAVAEDLVRLKLAERRRIDVVPEAPDATGEPWETATCGNPEWLPPDADPRPVIVSVGTLDPRKDLAAAREAFVRLVEGWHAPGPPPRWLWIGGPGPRPDPTPVALARRAAALGFATVGEAPGEAVRMALRRAAVFVAPSRAEGFGLPVVEALAQGCPVVVSDIPAHREVAAEAALYFPPGDAAALARALERILTQPALRARRRAAGRRRAEAFDWRRAAEMTCAVYRRAFEARAAQNAD